MGHEVKNLYRASYLERTENKQNAQNAGGVSFLFSIVKSLIIIKILFAFIPDYLFPNIILNSIESLTYPLVAPFFYLFSVSASSESSYWVSIFALIFYWVLGFLIVKHIESQIASAPAEE